MTQFLFDNFDFQIWYDMKSDLSSMSTWYCINYKHKPNIYIRPHREDGPAITHQNGYEAYFIQGLRHRDDGPAIIYDEEDVEWWLDGKFYEFEGWCKILNKSEEEINFLKLKWKIT